MNTIVVLATVSTFIVTMLMIAFSTKMAYLEEQRELSLWETRRLLESKSTSNAKAPVLHRHRVVSAVEVKDIFEEEVLAWLCPECHETVKPIYSIPRDPSTVKMLIGWQDA